MILINLLPHREIARKKRKDVFYLGLGLSAVAGVVLSALGYLWIQAEISAQQDQNLTLQTEIRKFDAQIKDIAGIEMEIAALRARQKAVEDLQADRNMPVHLLTELVHQLPEGVFIKNMRQEGQVVTLQGVAQSNERVSEMLRNLANRSPWFSRPELIEIVAGTLTLQPRDQRRVANFSLRVHLLRANELDPSPAAKVPAPVTQPAPVNKG